MKITIFGTGYVGLVTGACLADVGHTVLCMDVDQGKIDKLRNGHIPIYEPGLESIVKHTVEAGRLAFTTDTQEAVAHGSLQFIAVGTPPDEDGSADLQYVTAVARSIGQYMDDYKVVVDKSDEVLRVLDPPPDPRHLRALAARAAPRARRPAAAAAPHVDGVGVRQQREGA